ncbi:hypothetical protein D3C76_1174580 [compost metagenome]
MGFDGDVFTQRFRRLGILLLTLNTGTDASQHLNQIGGFGILQVNHFGIALHGLLTIQLLDHGDNPLAGVGFSADQDRVGSLIRNKIGYHQAWHR